LPNGFYNPTGTPIVADPARKENIILTVGRIGTAPKNNEELLSAFVKVSEVLSEWSLRLVGPIEPKFQTYINEYFSQHPHLKGRVVFKGAITDKTELYNEYARAKVFALTSRSEGGTPNVYAEALFHGCMFVTSDIDASDDITNYGELGTCYKSGDLQGLANSLIKTCTAADKKGMSTHIPKALAYAAKYYDWSRNARKLAYMLFK
jgi:glycosyltransferase involved in cell wall biosynthesis